MKSQWTERHSASSFSFMQLTHFPQERLRRSAFTQKTEKQRETLNAVELRTPSSSTTTTCDGRRFVRETDALTSCVIVLLLLLLLSSHAVCALAMEEVCEAPDVLQSLLLLLKHVIVWSFIASSVFIDCWLILLNQNAVCNIFIVIKRETLNVLTLQPNIS